MTPQQLVHDIKHLVSLPDIFLRINEMIDSPRYSAADIGEVIAQDTDLSARLLRTVNSAFYGLRGPVETISRAVTIIGTWDLRDLAVMTSAADLFDGIPVDLISMSDFWRYSVSTGVIARDLAERCHVLHSERLYVMGVLHDIGRLALFKHLPQESRDILLIIDGNDHVVPSAELDVLGFTHMEVGHELLKLWGLPESFQAVTRYHHQPSAASLYHLEASLIHLGSALATGLMIGEPVEESLAGIDPSAWQVTGLAEEEVGEVMLRAPEEIDEMLSVILPPGDTRRKPHI